MERKSDDTTSRRREVVADRAGEAPAPGGPAVEPGLAALVTGTSLILPSNLQFEEWVEIGQALYRQQNRIQWWVGDYWRHGAHAYGQRSRVAAEILRMHPNTCANWASTARAFAEVSRRRTGLTFTHHTLAAAETPQRADELLDWCLEPVAAGGKPHSTRELREKICELGEKDKEGDEREGERRGAARGGLTKEEFAAAAAKLTVDIIDDGRGPPLRIGTSRRRGLTKPAIVTGSGISGFADTLRASPNDLLFRRLEALVRDLKDEQKRIVSNIPEESRIALLRGVAIALSVSVEKLKPIESSRPAAEWGRAIQPATGKEGGDEGPTTESELREKAEALEEDAAQ
jgi:hypothetical protein